jgi:hypothetical protein
MGEKAMRTEREIRDKVREVENLHKHIPWDTEGEFDREWKIRCRHEIRGLLYSLGYHEEEVMPMHHGELSPSVYEVREQE